MKTLFSLLISLFLLLSAQAEPTLIWRSEILVPGESVDVYIVLENGKRFSIDYMPEVKNGSINLGYQGFFPKPSSPSERVYMMSFKCIPYKTGTMDIPSFSVKDDGGRTEQTLPQSIPVVPFDKIKWLTADKAGESATYGVLINLPSSAPYVNEPVKCELKIYAQAEFVSMGTPQLKTEGLALNRFMPRLVELMAQSVVPSGEALLKGKNWNVYSYFSTITPLQPGPTALGPGTVDASTPIESVDSRFGQVIRQLILVSLNVPETVISAKALPDGAPAGYRNAIGKFELSSETSATDITEGEPISVTVKIRGNGNLNILDCPRPDEEDSWKVYPPNKIAPSVPSPDTVEFQLLMKPLKQVDHIPSFKLVYFDPETKSYGTATSQPIPLKWKAVSLTQTTSSAPPPPAGIVPVEEMSDILYTTDSPRTFSLLLSTWFSGSAWWPWMLLPSLALFVWGIALRIKEKNTLNASKKARLQKLYEINPSADSISFLRSLGTYIESEIPENSRSEEIRDILDERDNFSFLPGDLAQPELPSEKRKTMLKAVRKIVKTLPLLLVAVTFALSQPSMQAAEETASSAFISGDYKKAKELISQEKESGASDLERANRYYLEGNIDYKLDNPGQAALNYHKALLLAPDHYEARRNLAFIERKEGSLTYAPSSVQEIIAKVPFSYYHILFLIALLAFTSIAAGMWTFRKKGVSQWFLFGLSLLLLAGSAWSLARYPENSNPLYAGKQFVITKKDASAWTAATRNSAKALTKLPPASIARILQEAESWLYVEFPSGTRAWVPEDAGEVLAD